VDAGLSAAGNLGYRVVFAVGDLAYLGRFGFSPASTANLASAVEVPVAAKRFFVLGLDELALEGLDGTVVPAAN
jgi:predicted N-acetyltransferase YhbS